MFRSRMRAAPAASRRRARRSWSIVASQPRPAPTRSRAASFTIIDFGAEDGRSKRRSRARSARLAVRALEVHERMQLDAIRGDAPLTVDHVEEPDAGDGGGSLQL